MARVVTNAEIARVLKEIALFLEMEGVAFKPRAYEKAGAAVESLDRPLGEICRAGGAKAVEKIPGVGRSIAEKIVTLAEKGKLPYYEELRRKTPVDVTALSAIEGMGPKMIRALYEELGVRSVADLERAAAAGKVRGLAHFGEKSEQKILKGIGFLQKSGGRFPLGAVLPLMHDIQERLEQVQGVKKVVVAGSVRRRKETVGDGDLVVVASKASRVMDCFVAFPEVVHVHGKGTTKASVRLDTGMDVDLRVVPESSFGAALNYFTGSKDHNVVLRRRAQDKKLKLNEYGLFRGDRAIAGRTEKEIYSALGLAYIPPEMRENSGEIEAAAKGELPDLIDYGDLRGDLQTQTNWTDGAHSIEQMARKAQELGLEYFAVTDHTRGLHMVGGADEKKLRRQMAAIDKLNKKLDGIHVLKGAEVNINRDGTLDIDDETLAQLDVVGVAVHSHFNLPREEMTGRIVRAMENPHADILFHPTGRVLQKREAYELDIDAVIDAARRTGTVLEIDAHPERLDLKDEHVRKAVQAGVKLAIDTDAHSVPQLDYLHFGVATARRGWAKKSDVVNTRPLRGFLRCLKGGRRRAVKRR
jgi:DNA polymerase (family 10)